MKHESNQMNASVAWFKLAELIMRREREKALSVYRLLAHSLEDRKAYALQLEGDILWSLDDKAAPEKYRQAAFLYHKEKQWVDAAALCEHLYTLNNNDVELISHLVRYYSLLSWPDRFVLRLTDLHKLVEKKIAQESHVIAVIKQCIEDVPAQEEQHIRTWIFDQITPLLPYFSQEVVDQIERVLT